jgi:glycosyltransferase involved in cell wall biosynthesis
MRVLIVNKFARVTGGADQYCLLLAEELRRRGHSVAFLSTQSTANLDRSGRFVPCTVTNESRNHLTLSARAAVARRALWNHTAYVEAKELISEFRPDVVHCHKLYPQLSVAPVVAAARARVPIVQTIHDYEFVSADHTSTDGGWYDRHETRLSYKALNAVTYGLRRGIHRRLVSEWVAVSRFVARTCENRDIGPVTVIENFVLPTRESQERKGYADRDGVVFVGRLANEKGVADVLRLAHDLPGARITIAGAGPLRDRVEAAAAAEPRLTYVGVLKQADVMELLSQARVSVMPSKWDEPGPLVALEAMAAGTPIVTYDRGGLAEYVAVASAGEVVSANALTNAVGALLSDSERWTVASDAALAAASSAHAPDRHVSRLIGVYEAARRSPGREGR